MVLFGILECVSWRHAGGLAACSPSLPGFIIPLQSRAESLPALEGFDALEVWFFASPGKAFMVSSLADAGRG